MPEERENVLESSKEVEHTPDALLRLCGDGGAWQLKVFLIAALAGFPAALQDFIYIFIAAPPDEYHCQLPSCFSGSYENIKNLTVPWEYSDGESKYSSCSLYALYNSSGETCTPADVNYNLTERCAQYDYFSSTMKATIISEWNQVCGNEFRTSTSQAVYALGSLTGSIVFGMISDNLGRKRAVLISLLISIIMSPIVSFAPSYETFLIARYFLAVGTPAIYDVTYILILEMIGSEWRGMAGNAFGVPYALGYSGTAVFAYFIRDWRRLQLALTAATLLFMTMFVIFIPESPRWLLSAGRAGEAETLFREIAKANSKTLPPNFSDLVAASIPKDTAVKEKHKISSTLVNFFTNAAGLFRTPNMRKRTLVLNFTWFATMLVYYGVALNAPNLSANLFTYTVFSGLLEIPSYLIVPPLIGYFGRRYVFSALLLLSGISLAGTVFLTPGSVAVVALALIGMFHMGAAYALVYLYGLELLPTVLRTYGIGLAGVSGQIGNAAAPFITNLLGAKNNNLPAIIFSVVSVTAGLSALLLPETKDKPLPETIEDIEKS